MPSPESIADELRRLDLPRGEGVYLVGGTVRDLLLGRTSFDVDIAVEGDALEFARSLGGEVTAHGRFGTAVVRFGDGRRVHSCELRDESASGHGWLVLLRDNGDPLFGCRCADERQARFVADCLRRDTGRTGWKEE